MLSEQAQGARDPTEVVSAEVIHVPVIEAGHGRTILIVLL
jgi:hypothetical protein